MPTLSHSTYVRSADLAMASHPQCAAMPCFHTIPIGCSHSSLNHSQLHNVKMRKTNRWHLLVIWSHKHWHRERCCRHSSAAAHVAVRCVLLQPVSLLLEHAGGVYAISKVSSGAIFSCSNDFTVRQVRSHRMRAKPQPSQAKPQHAVRTDGTNSMAAAGLHVWSTVWSGQHHSAAHRINPQCAS